MDATLRILDALGSPFEWEPQKAGAAALKDSGDPLPPSVLGSIRRTGLALKGPLETPIGGGYRSSNVRLREEFLLYANVRPARTIQAAGTKTSIWSQFERTLKACTSVSTITFRSMATRTPWRSDRESIRAQDAGALPNSPSSTL
jgi:isocitrate/isopropylmalate dehydrogenase